MKPIERNSKITFKPNKGTQQRKQTILPKGTIVKFNGFPFELKNDTFVYGCASNYRLGKELQDGPDTSPTPNTLKGGL